MLEGKCSKCGARYFGWSLRFPRNQTCPKCGVGLEITEDGEKITGYSPFTAEKYVIKAPAEAEVTAEKKKETDEQSGP